MKDLAKLQAGILIFDKSLTVDHLRKQPLDPDCTELLPTLALVSIRNNNDNALNNACASHKLRQVQGFPIATLPLIYATLNRRKETTIVQLTKCLQAFSLEQSFLCKVLYNGFSRCITLSPRIPVSKSSEGQLRSLPV